MPPSEHNMSGAPTRRLRRSRDQEQLNKQQTRLRVRTRVGAPRGRALTPALSPREREEDNHACLQNPRRSWERPKNLNLLAVDLRILERLLHRRVVTVTVRIDVERVVPVLASRWPFVNVAQVHARVVEGLKYLNKRTVFILGHKGNRGLVVPRPTSFLFRDHVKASDIVRVVLDPFVQDRQSIQLPRELRCDRGRPRIGPQ